MALKGTFSLFARFGRAFLTRPHKLVFHPQVYQVKPALHKIDQLYVQVPKRFYLFPSIYRSFFAPSNGQYASNLMPYRMIMDNIKRRLFLAAPSGSRFMLGLLGYSIVQQSSDDHFSLNETCNKIKSLFSTTTTMDKINDEQYSRVSLKDFELGNLIGCGCNAAVYEARLHSSKTLYSEVSTDESDIEILSPPSSNSSSSFEIINDREESLHESVINDVQQQPSTTHQMQSSYAKSFILPAGEFNLAVKMLFNYGIQSNAAAIEKAMENELIPLRKSLYHPNIVRMYSSFVDSFPLLKEAFEHYPMAIPTRFSPDSYGRNKTLFIVMKRYDLTLSEYIKMKRPTARESLILFAQLLEALLYLSNRSIAHRDLKGDNLLICNETGELVLTDFGCALYYPPDLKVPYQTSEVSRDGNMALMAPEILTCQPGPKSYLDYRKSDLWASGSLCYEFFSQSNPFFHGQLRQISYDDKNLPSLSPNTSLMVERLIHSMLRRDPEQRPSITLAANCIHLCLWFKRIKSKNELYQSHMWMAVETLFNKRSLTRVELSLKKLFFERQTWQSLSRAQTFLDKL